MTDEEPAKWKVLKITANTEIKSALGVRCWAELASVCNVKSKSVKKQVYRSIQDEVISLRLRNLIKLII